MIDCEDLKKVSLADERHQREWREWFAKTFDENGNYIENDTVEKDKPKAQKKSEPTFNI